jgi:hypothetical protein
MKLLNKIKTHYKQQKYGQDWTYLDQSQIEEGLDITKLVSPLRYDIVIRRDFISFYLAHKKMYRTDFNGFMDKAVQHPYFVCFQKMEPELVEDETACLSSFAEKVQRFVTVYEAIATDGFDKSEPIIPKTGTVILPTKEGKKISTQFFMGDGCHRLASLMALGYQTLPSDHIRVKSFPKLSPIDGTVQLIHDIPIPPEAYYEFLSSRYANPHAFTSRSELLAYVEREKPEWIDEVLSVLRADGMMQ